MSLFTNETCYALNAIQHLRGFSPINERNEDIALAIGAPAPFLARIMMDLAKAEIVSVKRGPNGGFNISEAQLRRFKVLDILRVFGHSVDEASGERASTRLNNAAFDALNVTLEEFLA